MKIIAHRGASFDAPENTLEAVKLAWLQNTDAVEIDIQLTRDGRIVAFHDDDLLRMTGFAGTIYGTSYPDLQKLKVTAKGQAYSIPLLENILETIPAEKFLVIEIKCGLEIIQPLKQIVSEAGLTASNLQFISLDENVMNEIFMQFPGFETQRVFEFDQEPPHPKQLLQYAKNTPLTGIDLEAGKYIVKEFVRAIHDFGKKIYVWTVNDPDEAQRFKRIGIDGITTDKPGWLKQNLGGSNES